MPLYRAIIVRSYAVTIECETEEKAARLSEFFIGHSDLSTIGDREQQRFDIKSIELLENDAIEIEALTSVE